MNTRHLSVLFLATIIIVALAAEGLALGKGADTILVEACTGESIELNGYENRMLDLHNQIRADHGLQSLCVNPALTQAARAHSQQMLDDGYFGHNSFDGETFKDRLEDFGYPSCSDPEPSPAGQTHRGSLKVFEKSTLILGREGACKLLAARA
jgi:Cysteine-rich secretory protein family